MNKDVLFCIEEFLSLSLEKDLVRNHKQVKNKKFTEKVTLLSKYPTNLVKLQKVVQNNLDNSQ